MTTTAPPSTDLEKHLQAACDLELWTIPLYLTAAYSITSFPSLGIPGASSAPDPQTEILSVAVQEMYHLQLACNLTTSYGFTPQLHAPKYDLLPFIHPDYQPEATVRLGNVTDVIDLMVEVETPDESNTGPVSPRYDKDGNLSYKSIGDLYSVLKILMGQADLATGAKQNVSTTFSSRYNVNKVDSYDDPTDPNTVLNSAHVIVDQGEGMRGEPAAFLDHDQFTEPTPGSRFYQEDHVSHWYRFELVRDLIQQQPNSLQVYVTNPYDPKTATQKQKDAQAALNVVFTKVLSDLRTSWQDGDLNLDSMWLIKPALINVLTQGIAPQFDELKLTPPELNKRYAKVADDVDPCYTVRPLLDPTKKYEKYPELHACQGLNECKGLGAPLASDPKKKATGSKAGDGNCATVVPHTCGGGNDCKFQGGCGYSPYLPGANTGGAGSGGCETPISPWQVFDTSGDPNPPPDVNSNIYVWDRARELLAKRLNVNVKDLPKVETNQRRECVIPSIKTKFDKKQFDKECNDQTKKKCLPPK